MKLFAFILTVYVGILTAYPCVDAVSDKSFQKMEVSHPTTDNHTHDCDKCSPFCTCNCCVSPVVVSVFTDQVEGCWFSQKYFFRYLPSYHSSPCSSFWQPPKIA